MIFWSIATAMVAIALAFLLPPLLRRPRGTGPARSAINVDLYRDRLAELENDRANGNLTEEEYTQARGELERAMLDDVDATDETVSPAASTPRALVITVALFVPLLAGAIYWKLGAVDHAAGVHAGASAASTDANMHSIEDMVSKLAAKLAADPNNADGWAMLGRSYVVLGRYPDAVLAFAKARELAGDEAELLADQAEAMALGNGNMLAGEPETLIKRALKKDPNNPKTLWLAGHAAIQHGDTASGVAYWRRLVAQLPVGSEGRRKVEGLIAQAEGQTPSAAAPSGQANAGNNAAITVQVALAPEFRSKVAPEDTVFVFARAAEGPKMPLAIVKKQVKDLPLTVTLDDSMAMMPQMRLSNFPKVIVGARVSKSGAAMPASGDIEGQSPVLASTNGKTVSITIQRAIP